MCGPRCPQVVASHAVSQINQYQYYRRCLVMTPCMCTHPMLTLSPHSILHVTSTHMRGLAPHAERDDAGGRWSYLPTSWLNGPFTGNGVVGTVVYFCNPPDKDAPEATQSRGGLCWNGNATQDAEYVCRHFQVSTWSLNHLIHHLLIVNSIYVCHLMSFTKPRYFIVTITALHMMY